MSKLNSEQNGEMDIIAYTLLNSMGSKADPSLEVEVFWSAMNYLKQHPQASIKEACCFGMDEWFK